MAITYNLVIMKHSRQPLNRGRLKKPDLVFSGANYSCGDSLSIYIALDKNKRIKKVSWDGAGCAVSLAGASVFSEMIKGKTISQVKKMKSDDIIKKLEISLSPVRRKCAVLPLHIVKDEKNNAFSTMAKQSI